MKVVVTGSSGLIGSALCTALVERGDTVTRMVRSESAGGQSVWRPTEGMIDDEVIAAADVVVHLAGAGIGDKRWTSSRKAAVLRSRTEGTRLIASSALRAENPPFLVCASAIGFYGERGEEVLTEASDQGDDGEFLVQVVTQWEAAAEAAVLQGVSVAHLRSGIVMAKAGGALKKMLIPFRFGLGGKFGTGKQWWPWVSLHDEVRAILFIIDNRLTGSFNIVAPQEIRQKEFAKTLGSVLRRPTLFPLPRFVARTLLGREMADSLLFASQRVHPHRLLAHGFEFEDEDLAGALRRELSGRPTT